MKQRLGIAQALINDPGIVLLDEPVSALDPIGRKEVMDIVMELAGKVTVFFSTHVLADVERVCDRVVIINKGRAVLEDTIGNIKSMAPSRQIEIELLNKSTKSLVEDIKRLEWLDEVIIIDEKKIKLVVSDIERASLELPGIIHNADVSLKKFNIQEPTLEDIFIKAVNGN
jgi:ABC-2 type transport system ATP-binding protein